MSMKTKLTVLIAAVLSIAALTGAEAARFPLLHHGKPPICVNPGGPNHRLCQ